MSYYHPSYPVTPILRPRGQPIIPEEPNQTKPPTETPTDPQADKGTEKQPEKLPEKKVKEERRQTFHQTGKGIKLVSPVEAAVERAKATVARKRKNKKACNRTLNCATKRTVPCGNRRRVIRQDTINKQTGARHDIFGTSKVYKRGPSKRNSKRKWRKARN